MRHLSYAHLLIVIILCFCVSGIGQEYRPWSVPHPEGLSDRFSVPITTAYWTGDPPDYMKEQYMHQALTAYGNNARDKFNRLAGHLLLPYAAILLLVTITVISNNGTKVNTLEKRKSNPVYLVGILLLLIAFLTFGWYGSTLGDFLLFIKYAGIYQLVYLLLSFGLLFLSFRILSNRDKLQLSQKVLISFGLAGGMLLALNKLNEFSYDTDYSLTDSLSQNPINWLSYAVIIFGFSYYLFGKSTSVTLETQQSHGKPI